MRLVGTASYPNDGSDFAARGGIIAHQIGYGKTVVIIALISLMRAYDASNSIEQRKHMARRLWETETAFIHLKATLIVVPKHIVTQWKNEFEKFLGLGKGKMAIIIVRAVGDWRKMTLEKLKSADIIIVSTALWSASYSDMWTRSFTIDPTVAKESPRERTDRYRLFYKTLRAVVTRWNRGGVTDAQASEYARQLMTDAKTEYKRHSKNYVGGSTRKGRASPGGPEEDQEAEEEGNGGGVAGADKSRSKGAEKSKQSRETSWTPTMFLENFTFARVVLDEFSYKDKPDVFLFLAEALAWSKWLLSGTPRLGNLADVDDLARPLQVHVARPDPCVRSDLDPITKGPVLEPTALGEEIRLHAAALRSCNLALGRHQAGEDFIRHFLRADKTDRTGLPVREAVVPLQILLHARLVYHVVELMLSHARDNVFDLPYEVRCALGLKFEKGKDGKEEAERLLLQLATLPSTLDTVAKVRGASDKLASLNTTHLKSFSDKLIWAASRSGRALRDQTLSLATCKDYEEKLQLVRQLVEARVAEHRRLSSEDGGEPVGYQSFGGKVYGLELLGNLYPSPASAPAEEESSAWWTNFRGNGARFFWPDWFEFDDDVVASLGEGGDASDKEVVDLVVDAILFARTHQAGRAISSANKEGWLEKHVAVVQQVLVERHLSDVLSRRDNPLADGLTTRSVEELVSQYTRGEHVAFLMKCNDAREEWAGAPPKHPELAISNLERLGKSDLLKLCGSYQLKIAPSAGVKATRDKLKKHFSESLKTSAYVDGRAFHVLSILPIPGQMVSRDGGRNEAVVEEMLGALQQVESCQQDLVEACRRRNLLKMIDGNNGEVEWPALESDGVPKCHCCSMPLTSSAGWAGCYVLVACGHRLCDAGKAAVPSGPSAVCPVKGCGALCRRSAIVPLAATDCASSHNDPEDKQKKKKEVVDKLAYLIELVAHGIPEDDHVIIFTIFEDFAKSLDSQLKAEGVTTLSLIGEESTAKMTEDFKSGRARVLFMDPTHEHAAGSNLTVANHVIFVSPAAERDPHTRNMHHQQGIGRSLRQGQRKTVHIYNLMTESTMDELLLRGLTQERASQPTVVGDLEDPLVAYFESATKPWWLEEKSEATTTVAHWGAANLNRNRANGVSRPPTSSSAAAVPQPSSVPAVAPVPSPPASPPPYDAPWAPPKKKEWSNQVLYDRFPGDHLYDR
jgi:hypothetical protein